jgi:hypothetical protein
MNDQYPARSVIITARRSARRRAAEAADLAAELDAIFDDLQKLRSGGA